MKRMAYPASHFMNTSSEFVTIHSLNPNQSNTFDKSGSQGDRKHPYLQNSDAHG